MNYDAFCSSQYLSKMWLVQTLENVLPLHLENAQGYNVWILAGWYGVTNLILMTRGRLKISSVRSFDIDPDCEKIAEKINEPWVWRNWQFKAYTQDINKLSYDIDPPDVVINTSLEHLDSDVWFNKIPKGTVVAFQGSDLDHEDHNADFSSLDQLKQRYLLDQYWFEGLKMFQYDDNSFQRFMIVGIK